MWIVVISFLIEDFSKRNYFGPRKWHACFCLFVCLFVFGLQSGPLFLSFLLFPFLVKNLYRLHWYLLVTFKVGSEVNTKNTTYFFLGSRCDLTIEGFHVTSHQANFASHHTCDRHFLYVPVLKKKKKKKKKKTCQSASHFFKILVHTTLPKK